MKINRNMMRKMVLAVLVGTFAKAFEVEQMLPLVALCAGDSGGAGDSGSGDSNGDTSGSMGSTPFLCTWNGTSFEFENDVLFGKPSSIFPTEKEGKRNYEQGSVTGDLYKISNAVVVRNGRIPFQIKEIEPEESYIDHLSLLQVTHPIGGEVIVHSDFTNYTVFEKQVLANREGIRSVSITNKEGDITKRICLYGENEHPLEMQMGDSFEVQIEVEDVERPLYFLLGSLYRDWTIGEIAHLSKEERTPFLRDRISEIFAGKKTVSTILVGSARVLALAIVVGAVWTFNSVHNVVSSSSYGTENDVSKLAFTYGIKTAHADVPARSLVVDCLVNGSYEQIDVIQPRYYQRTVEAVRIPPAAIQSSGKATLRVTATKRHNVTNAYVVAPSSLLTAETKEFKVCSAKIRGSEKDYAPILNAKYSGEYLHTVPADVVDVEFGPVPEEGMVPDMTHTYIVKAHGYYTPLSEETRNKVGEWTDRLDSDSMTVLQDLYALQMHSKDTGSNVA